MSACIVESVNRATDEVRALIEELDRTLAQAYSPDQRHGLTLDAIFQPHVRFFVARVGGVAAGCGAIALLSKFAELKRMYVREAHRGRGIAQMLLAHLECETIACGRDTLRLETGERQIAALRLYERAGFHRCGAFGDYLEMTPQAIITSVFMEKRLAVTTPSPQAPAESTN